MIQRGFNLISQPIPVARETVQVVTPVIDQTQYIRTLEAVNEQLSLAWTPLNTLVGAVSLLVAVGAVLGAFLLFRQSQDHQRQIDRFLSEAKADLDAYIAATDEQKELVVAELRTLKETVPDEARKRVEATIARLSDSMPAGSGHGSKQYGPNVWPAIAQAARDAAMSILDGVTVHTVQNVSPRAWIKAKAQDGRQVLFKDATLAQYAVYAPGGEGPGMQLVESNWPERPGRP